MDCVEQLLYHFIFMHDYLFILGRDPELSALEIKAYLNRKDIEHSLKEHNDSVCLMSLKEGIKTDNIIKDLGGTVKIAVELNSLDDIVIEKNKISYGVTQIKCDSSKLLKQLDERFREERVKAVRRYGSMHEIPPSKSKHLDIEIILYKSRIFRVVSVSNPKEYKSRDANRPAFDPLKETSIRLAKILVNLSEAKKEVMDPFCGTGTILQEALLMGYSVIGIDTSINDAKRNIDWIGNDYSKKARLLRGDARKVSNYVREVEAIVTEPYLGPYIRRTLEKNEALKIRSELERLYFAFLNEASKIVRGRVVMIAPRFRTRGGEVALNFDSIISKTGFRKANVLKGIEIPIVYRYKTSKIERLIYVLEKR